MGLMESLREGYRHEQQLRAAAHRVATSGKAGEIITTCNYLVDTYKMVGACAVGAGYVGVHITIQNLEGLKDENLAKLISSLLGHNPAREATDDYPHAYNRDYRFSWSFIDETTGTNVNLAVTVCAYFKSDSETCKRVIVGYKEIPKEPAPIYELRCVDPAEQPSTVGG